MKDINARSLVYCRTDNAGYNKISFGTILIVKKKVRNNKGINYYECNVVLDSFINPSTLYIMYEDEIDPVFPGIN